MNRYPYALIHLLLPQIPQRQDTLLSAHVHQRIFCQHLPWKDLGTPKPLHTTRPMPFDPPKALDSSDTSPSAPAPAAEPIAAAATTARIPEYPFPLPFPFSMASRPIAVRNIGC